MNSKTAPLIKLTIAWFLMLASFAIYAQEQKDCSGESFKDVRSLSQLPDDVVKLLRRESNVVDRGEEFEATDVPSAVRLPSRRFSMAAVNPNRMVISIQHGGGLNFVEVWEFKRSDFHWSTKGNWRIVSLPATLEELLFVPCNGYQMPYKGEPRPEVSQITKSDGSIILSLSNSEPFQVYKLDRSKSAGGASRFGQVTNYMRHDGRLSTQEKQALLIKLEEKRESITESDPAYVAVCDFINVLTAERSRSKR